MQLPEPNCDDEPMLVTTVVIKRKRCWLRFHRGYLIWETMKAPIARWTLPLTDVLTATYGNEAATSLPLAEACKEMQPAEQVVPATSTTFVLHYAARDTKNKWRRHEVVMSHDDPRQVASWVKTIRNYLAKHTNRPRKILFFVNPFGGKRKGFKIWEKTVQPLMNLVGIEFKVIVTQRPGHIEEVLMNCELDSYQAAVCIGGDGTFAALFNGLILRTARDRRIDLNDPAVELPKPRLAVGVIPGGSTDTLAYSLHGSTDVETACIHVIFGDCSGLDVSSVHSEKQLLRVYASILSYGYLGDVLRDSEKFRWMGPQRYDYSGFKKIIANKGYEGEIALLSETDHPSTCTKCTNNCNRCIEKSRTEDSQDKVSSWLTVRGKFFMVNGANVSCACSKSPMGFSPHCHIGDGCVDVILVRHTSLLNNIRMLWRLSSKDKTLYDLPFVEVYRAREFVFRASDSLNLESTASTDCIVGTESSVARTAVSVWNCDGEVIDAPSVKIKVHCQLLKVLSRRMQVPPTDSPSCFCFRL
ncbi:ceramide kinase [Trichogramma pretiosum]|uniref:ceramide kinase n=1 Tax=Trichogramma pretiosum TaxID=7493 RepID=UPI0006C9CEE7|nr:ceramide kinase [Trichogramma pretiosum]